MFNEIVTEKMVDIKEIEKKIYKMMCEKACELMKLCLESLDVEILKQRDVSIYRNKGVRETTLKTVMGDVTFGRRIYINKETRK